MTNVFGGLWISDSETVKDIYFLKENNIKTIINCTQEIPNYFLGEFRYVKLGMLDNLFEEIDQKLRLACYFIKNSLDNNEGVIVHCHMGVSRSATVVIYFLMKTYSWSYNEAYGFLKTKRRVIHPNSNYETQLRRLQLFKIGTLKQ
jgi:protein-tyrosine phosphatase